MFDAGLWTGEVVGGFRAHARTRSGLMGGFCALFENVVRAYSLCFVDDPDERDVTYNCCTIASPMPLLAPVTITVALLITTIFCHVRFKSLLFLIPSALACKSF